MISVLRVPEVSPIQSYDRSGMGNFSTNQILEIFGRGRYILRDLRICLRCRCFLTYFFGQIFVGCFNRPGPRLQIDRLNIIIGQVGVMKSGGGM